MTPAWHSKCPIELQPGEERSLIFALGEGDNAGHARTLAARYRDMEQTEAEYRGALASWDRLLSAVSVETPDSGMNMLLNRWLLYQSVSCRLWGRTAFYQSGGAYGFRDQLQDAMSLVYAAPRMAREQILRHAARQFKEGDVQHWWHPPTGRGVRTRFSDDLLWLPFVTAYYIEATGDTGILDEQLPFLQALLLTPDQEDMYSTPAISEEKGSVYEHCLRAIAHGTTAGAHGLPLMGMGDWNDGMNRVGREGRGESVWVGWFLYATLGGLRPCVICVGTKSAPSSCAPIWSGCAGRWSERHGMESGIYAPFTTTARLLALQVARSALQRRCKRWRRNWCGSKER
ncbi:MAG: hypothetical protein IVW55_15115 [Chloroflexi bacterium]|nr:hypothetical protein [Chloroflexota bacterium]